jgi:hypothetical protein
MKFVQFACVAVLGLVAPVAMAGAESAVERFGRQAQIPGGNIVVGATADVSGVYGRGTPMQATSMSAGQPVIRADRHVDTVQGRA